MEGRETGVSLESTPLGHEPGSLAGTRYGRVPKKAGTCTASAPKAQRSTLPYGGKCVCVVERLHQAKVSATDLHVTDDKRVMIYWEKCPVKSMLVDPIYCLIPFKYSYSYKDATQLQVGKRSGGNSPTRCLAHGANKPVAPSAGSMGQPAQQGSSQEMVGHLHHG